MIHQTTMSLKAKEILRANLDQVYRNTDRLFLFVILAQWAFAIILAVFVSPYTWSGKVRSVNFHVETAVIVGGILTIFPVWLLKFRSGWVVTRYVVTIAQCFWSALLIHLTGGRIETHFHIFGSLAFIAFYRDWKLLIPATLAIAGDHMIRGLVSPESVYGTQNHEIWRFLEHAGWVVFEDVVLFFACTRSVKEMELHARSHAELIQVKESIEEEVLVKSAALQDSSVAREQLQFELLQAQKLESVGRLASGIAHEINTPIQYVTDSVYFVEEAVGELFGLLDKLDAMNDIVLSPEKKLMVGNWIKCLTQDTDIDYLRDNLPKALCRSSEGLERVAEIVRSMKMFAHPDQKEMSSVDLNENIRTTLVVCRNEYKYVAEVIEDLADIPHVTCHAGEINQVFINLIVNAAHAIADNLSSNGELGKITIQTRKKDGNVLVSISDSGCGIPEENMNNIFEPFFTTKEVGKGTGQGLAVVHSAMAKLGGEVSVESRVGEGTTFFLTIPIEQAALTNEEVAA